MLASYVLSEMIFALELLLTARLIASVHLRLVDFLMPGVQIAPTIALSAIFLGTYICSMFMGQRMLF